jgi:hypothetical protein
MLAEIEISAPFFHQEKQLSSTRSGAKEQEKCFNQTFP